ncbi:hypothetical protein [Jatrophihabitans fulvus]
MSEPPARPRRDTRDDDPVLPDVTEDERDRGWGDDLHRGGDGGDRDAEWYRRQRPPHHE